MHTTDHAKFGNGILKDGEPENVRTWMDIMNETGCRKVLPFDGMTTGDAYLWAKYVDDAPLQQALKKITQKGIDNRRGFYGTTGSNCVIKNCHILKDVRIGSYSYIKGANKLKNLTINSSEAEPTQIGEGVELVNGIIGYGCHIFYGCKAVKFILGNNSNLKYGARLINSFLGDNSTISCCEVLNNLIFPAHEQHHNNSFLIASVVMGQSNMAAGATIGSNHNSRANDNEIQAGRGFWPGLCTSVKHSCRFASFTLLSKADYPAELDIPLPFSLLNNNVSKDRLEVMPAFWWMYNMYALARNAWKFKNRDKRIHKIQNIEFEAFA
jgi:NDP-sugar pyrophosphorylase family protein